MTGVIDEVVLYDRALSPEELSELIQEGIATVTPVEPAGKLATTWSQIKTRSAK